jgi:ornithine cyclodeaminase/alanine dehydrogenase-like protein (mu-crystallin family)
MHSNFITPPDLVETVLIVNATKEQIAACAETCKNNNPVYNVYFYHTDMNDVHWLGEVVHRSDIILQATDSVVPVLCPTVKFGMDQDLKQPSEYFNK